MMKGLREYEKLLNATEAGDRTGEADQKASGWQVPCKEQGQTNSEVITMEDADKLKQIEDVLKTWNSSTHKWRSSHAMVKINTIFAPAPKEK
jgi:hypothetical protein